MIRPALVLLLGSLALTACGHDERPIVVNTPPAQKPGTTVVVPPNNQSPVIVTPSE
jgi:hypothetical protein